MDVKAILTGGVILITAVILGWFYVEKARADDPYQDRRLLKKGEDLPRIWIYVNNSDVNARSWADFQARSSRALNLPFLNLCYQSIVKMNSELYRVEVIGGLQDLAVRFGGWEALPEPLRNAQTVVREPELNWIRAAVMSRWGGLWVSPATIFLKPIGELPEDKVVFFGEDSEPTFGGLASVPALNMAWSPCAMHPLWVEWEEMARIRLERRAGGSEFRRDQMADMVECVGKYVVDVEMRPYAEATRKGSAQRRIQLEDLLAAGSEGALPFEIGGAAVTVPIPYPELLEREAFGWFLRMSEEQILESDLAVSHLFRAVL
jgi:hypothetical protein